MSNWENCGPKLEECSFINDKFTEWAKDYIEDIYMDENPFYL